VFNPGICVVFATLVGAEELESEFAAAGKTPSGWETAPTKGVLVGDTDRRWSKELL
jgi:hypothetical protein